MANLILAEGVNADPRAEASAWLAARPPVTWRLCGCRPSEWCECAGRELRRRREAREQRHAARFAVGLRPAPSGLVASLQSASPPKHQRSFI